MDEIDNHSHQAVASTFMKPLRRLVAAGVLGALLASCSPSSGAPSSGVDVVAAFYPLAELARRLGGSGVGVTDLTPAGTEPHDLELRPGDLAALAHADLVLYVGGGFQPSVERAVKTLPTSVRIVDVLAVAPEPANDPHVWLDPVAFRRVAKRIATVLSEIVADKEAIAERTEAFATQLRALDRHIRGRLTDCRRREFITSHAAFGRFVARYGLRELAISGIDPEAEPSSARLQEVGAAARANGATTIFAEPLLDDRVARTVARIADARVRTLDPIESLTREQRDAGADYFSVMKQNAAALAEALGCR